MWNQRAETSELKYSYLVKMQSKVLLVLFCCCERSLLFYGDEWPFGNEGHFLRRVFVWEYCRAVFSLFIICIPYSAMKPHFQRVILIVRFLSRIGKLWLNVQIATCITSHDKKVALNFQPLYLLMGCRRNRRLRWACVQAYTDELYKLIFNFSNLSIFS